MKVLMLLSEVISNNAVSVNWPDDQPEYAEAEFTVGNVEYSMVFAHMDAEYISAMVDSIDATQFPRTWSMEFSQSTARSRGVDPIGVTGTGNAFAVFDAVIGVARQFAQSRGVQAYMFAGTGDSRQSLYDRLSARLGKQTINFSESGGKGYFVVL